MTVCFKDRGEIDVFVKYRIVSVNGAPAYEVEEVCDDVTGESISLSDDELAEIEAHLIDGPSS